MLTSKRLFDLPRHQLKNHPNSKMFVTKTDGEWKGVSTAQFLKEVMSISKGLISLGIQPGDNVGIVSNTRYEWNVMDIGIQQTGAIVVPFYPNISENDYVQILKDFKSHPINPPTSYDNRLERLFDLTRMVWADHIEGDDQLKMLKKLSIGLGFNPDNVNYIVDKALNLVHNNISLDDFIEQMKTMNQ